MIEIKPQYIDIVIGGEGVEDQIKDLFLMKYLFSRTSSGRWVFQIPIDSLDWQREMLCGKRMLDAIKELFGKNAYFGIAYVDVDIQDVVDENGAKVNPFTVVVDGIKCFKWVRKSLFFPRRVDGVTSNDSFLSIDGWLFDGRRNPPIFKILTLQSWQSKLVSNNNLIRKVLND